LSDALGLLLLAVYIVAIVGLAAAITWAVIKIFPTERKPKDPDASDDSKQNRGSESQAGSLFRRSKRAAT
jgi:cytoskeletal protein RodZ